MAATEAIVIFGFCFESGLLRFIRLLRIVWADETCEGWNVTQSFPRLQMGNTLWLITATETSHVSVI